MVRSGQEQMHLLIWLSFNSCSSPPRKQRVFFSIQEKYCLGQSSGAVSPQHRFLPQVLSFCNLFRTFAVRASPLSHSSQNTLSIPLWSKSNLWSLDPRKHCTCYWQADYWGTCALACASWPHTVTATYLEDSIVRQQKIIAYLLLWIISKLLISGLFPQCEVTTATL